MGVKIIITEKPSVAQEYKKVLKVVSNGKTDGYIEGKSSVLGDVVITWAVGHLIQICEPKKQNPEWEKWSKANLPMIPKQFKYEPQTATKKQFNVVKSLYTRKDIDCIYYAGDSGREGIYIQALIRNQIFKTNPKFEEKVVWIDSYTEDEILKGIKNAKPYSYYQPMIDSGYMRAITDWLIGINGTEAFTLTSGGYGNTINVGRVMTPTLAMVVTRDDEISKFAKTYYYGIKADNFASWKAVKGSRFFESDDLYNENGFIKKEKALNLISELNEDKILTVSEVKVQQKTEYAPYLFNLADLQAYCSKHFKISPADTLKIAQTLYENKFTTYPRTDARFLSSAVASDLKNKGYNVPNRYVDDSKVTDHYAIIPTFHGNADTLNGLNKSVYEAILKRFNDTLLPPYIYDAVVVTYIHSNKEKFFENFRVVKQYGFKNGNDDEVTKKDIPQKFDTVSVDNFNLHEMETKPPTAYTTGSLILAMEKAGKLIEDEELREQIKTSGIGTSATRASIIEKLEKIGFITIEKKTQKVSATDLGKSTISIVSKFDEALVSPLKTAEMENNLSLIANKEMSKDDYLITVTDYVSSLIKSILSNNTEKVVHNNMKKETSQKSSSTSNTNSSNNYNCPCCKETLKYGKYGWWCDCGFRFGNDICGMPMHESDLKDLLTKGKTKQYRFVGKNGKFFTARIVVDKKGKKTQFDFSNKK